LKPFHKNSPCIFKPLEDILLEKKLGKKELEKKQAKEKK
jgi:hypothetical protein